MEQVAGQDPMRLGTQELGPGGSGSPGCRIYTSVVQDLPDRGGADLIAEADEFTVDASITPGRVLRGQADRQGTEAGGDRWSAGSGGLGGPVARNESLVSAQDRRGGDEQPESAASREQSGQGGDQGSVGPADPRSRSAPLGAPRVGGAGRGSRRPWWCRIACAAISSSGAWRTPGRSAVALPADHAGRG